MDRWCGFTGHLTHVGGATPRRADHARHLFAAIIALACNLGTGRMARASDLSPAQIGWTSEWYLRHETLERATAAIVDHQSTIALAQQFGTGEHSSSDGKRRLVSPDSQQARALPRYFGRDRGLTHYAFVSDQHTHFATRVIRTTVRDATYVLDGILDNKTQLPIRTHSTDTLPATATSSSRSLTSSGCVSRRGSRAWSTPPSGATRRSATRPPAGCSATASSVG